MRVACIGSRALTPVEINDCEKIGGLIATRGWELHTGNAAGADQAFATGANRIDPSLVHLHLPWHSFKRSAVVEGNHTHVYPFGDFDFYREIAAESHPRWNQLKEVVQKLHTRNASILVPDRNDVDICLAWPQMSSSGGRGGTGQGMRIAEKRGLKLVDLTKTSASQVCLWIEEKA